MRGFALKALAKLLLAAGLLAAPELALAKDKLPKDHVTESVTIAAPPAKVWSIIQNWNDWSWHPAIKQDSAPDGNAVGTVRTLDLGGPKLTETLTRYDAGKMSYSYKINEDPANVKTLPVTHYTSTITVKPGPNNDSVVVWRGRFHRADPSATPAADMNDETATKAVTGVYRAGLDNLKKLAEAKS